MNPRQQTMTAAATFPDPAVSIVTQPHGFDVETATFKQFFTGANQLGSFLVQMQKWLAASSIYQQWLNSTRKPRF